MGCALGRTEGAPVGDVGFDVGLTLGKLVGDDDNVSEGFPLGSIEARLDGSIDGIELCITVGIRLDTSVGESDGPSEGLTLGSVDEE